MENEDSDVLLGGLGTNQRYNKIDIRMHNPHIEGSAELHLGLGILDQRYDLEDIVGEHQPDEFLVAAEEERKRWFSFDAVLVSEISF